MSLVKLWKRLVKSKKTDKKKTGPKFKKKSLKRTAKKINQNKPKVIKKKASGKKIKEKLSKEAQEKEIGVITHYFGKISVGIVKLKKPLRLGDKIHIKGAHDDFSQVVSSLQYNHKDISLAKKGLEVGIKVVKPVHQNDSVYR